MPTTPPPSGWHPIPSVSGASVGKSLNNIESPAKDMSPKIELVDNSIKGASVRKRACKPKVRTGCITCKVRRVKCDEGKPECRRCMVFGVKCDGYGLSPSPAQMESARALLPRSQDTLRVRNPSDAAMFQTEKENDYFRRFQDEIAAGLSGTLETSIWSRLMLQACHDEPFVRSAVVAISALATSKSLTYGSSTDIVAQHTEFALGQYEMAIRTMRESLTQQINNSPRRALIACLLVCCFESLSGHYFNTLGHAQSGHQLMRDWLGQFPEATRYMDGISSPAPEIIEDELIQAFTRLDNQVVTFFDSRPPEVHAELKDFGSNSIERMPEYFQTIEEARQYFTLIQARKCHFIQATSKAFYVDTSPNAVPYPPGPEPSSFFLEQRKYTMEFIHWASAFEPLYQSLRNSPEPRMRLAINILFVHCKVSQITLNSQPDPNSCAYDKHVSDFRLVVSIIRGLVDEFYRPGVRRQQPYFIFDHGLIPVLHTINLHCRDRRIRRESIALLKQMSCREGVWDSLMMAAMDERLMEVEEEGIDTYYIPAKSRVTKLNISIGDENRSATIEVVKGPEATGGDVLQFAPGKVEIAKFYESVSALAHEESRLNIPSPDPSTSSSQHWSHAETHEESRLNVPSPSPSASSSQHWSHHSSPRPYSPS